MRFLLVLPTLALGLLIPAQQVPAQQVGRTQSQFEVPPVLRTGDSWIYGWKQDARGRRSEGTYTRQVVRKDTFGGQEVYIISVTLRADYDVVDLHLSRIARVDGAGNVLVRYGIKGDHIFPLTVGRTFTRHEDEPRRSVTYIYKVENFVDIRTAAGVLRAVKVMVQGEGSWKGPYGSFSQESVMYFAPAAKVFVRYSSHENDAQGTTTYSEELVRYKVTPE